MSACVLALSQRGSGVIPLTANTWSTSVLPTLPFSLARRSYSFKSLTNTFSLTASSCPTGTMSTSLSSEKARVSSSGSEIPPSIRARSSSLFSSPLCRFPALEIITLTFMSGRSLQNALTRSGRKKFPREILAPTRSTPNASPFSSPFSILSKDSTI